MSIDLSLLSFLFLPFSVLMVSTFWHPPVSSWNPHILYFSSWISLFKQTISIHPIITQTICTGFSLPLFSLHFPFVTRRRCGGHGKTLPSLFLAHWISPSTFISITWENYPDRGREQIFLFNSKDFLGKGSHGLHCQLSSNGLAVWVVGLLSNMPLFVGVQVWGLVASWAPCWLGNPFSCAIWLKMKQAVTLGE